MESNLLIRINMIFKRTLSVSNWGAPFVTILVSSALGNYSNAWIVPFNCLIKSVLISSTGLNIFFFQINYIFKHLFFRLNGPTTSCVHCFTNWLSENGCFASQCYIQPKKLVRVAASCALFCVVNILISTPISYLFFPLHYKINLQNILNVLN